MGRFIQRCEHRKIVRAMQVLTFVILGCILINIGLFITFTLQMDGATNDGTFFTSILLAVIGMGFFCGAQLNFTVEGNYSIYRIAYIVYAIADISNVVYDVSYIINTGTEIDGFASLIFYLIIDSVNLIFNLCLILFVSDKIGKRPAMIAAIGQLIIILIYLSDIIRASLETGYLSSIFENSMSIVNLFSNFTMMIIIICSLLLVIAKPEKKRSSQN